MRKVVLHNIEPASIREDTERIVKILDSTFSKTDLEQVFNYSQLNAEEINLLLGLLKYFGDFFYGTLGNWATEPVDLELNPYYKPFNSRYYLVPRINKEKFRKKINRLV